MTAASNNLDISQFRGLGYQIFRDVVDAEIIGRVRDFLAPRIAETVEPAKQEIGCASDGEFLSAIGELAAGRRGGIAGLTKETRDALSGHFSLQTRLSPELWAIPLTVVGVLKTVLRSDAVFMHMPPTARYVLPGNIHAGVPPHQDVSYNKHMTDFVTMWVPLVDIDDECGGVTIFEGSGNAPEHDIVQSASEFWQKGVSTDGLQPVHCKISAGDILVFNKWVIHQSMPNLSNRIRLSIDFRFFGAVHKSSKHYLDLQAREVIAPSK